MAGRKLATTVAVVGLGGAAVLLIWGLLQREAAGDAPPGAGAGSGSPPPGGGGAGSGSPPGGGGAGSAPSSGPPSGSPLPSGVRVTLSNAANAAARDADHVNKVNDADAQKSQRATADWNSALESAASAVPYVGAVYAQFSKTARRNVWDPKIGPVVDPLGEAYNRLPEELRAYLLAAAARLPPVANEDKIQPVIMRPRLRLVAAAIQRGYWPGSPNQNPDGSVVFDVLNQQLEAWGRVAQEVLGQ